MTNNIPRDHIDLQLIEWPEVEKLVHHCAYFSETKAHLTRSILNRAEIQTKLAQTSSLLPFFHEQDFQSLINSLQALNSNFEKHSELTRLQKSHTLSIAEVHYWLQFIELYFENFRTIHKYFPIEINFDQNKFKQRITNELLREFRSFVSKEGDINLERHPRVKNLVIKIKNIEETIRSSLNHSLASSELSSKVQFSTIDIINDRYVIPIKSDSYSNAIGLIVHRSDSGNTLYVEPRNISKLNYERIELLVELTAIINKIEIEITQTLYKYFQEFQHILDFIFELDDTFTRITFANKYGLTYPVLTQEKGFNLKNAFHLLIDNPVTNNIELTDNHDGLIISGPNTGGKTATLKLLAINQLLVKYGFFVPCSDCSMHLYDEVFYFGNDNQDINNGLSSFSAEVQSYTQLFEHLKDSNLILIDEIFNSTSSEEASALAIALFEQITKDKKSQIIVSSHHQTLKTLLHQNNDFISAHVGFNMDTNKPTFKLHYGSPGASQALRIFKNITSDKSYLENIYKRSIQLLDNKSLHYEKLLDSLAHKEHELNKVLMQNNEINVQLKNQKKSMEGVINIKVNDAVIKTEKKLHKLISKAENIVLSAKSGTINKAKQLHKKTHELKSELNQFKEAEVDDSHEYENLSIPANYEENKNYFSIKLKKTVLLKRIEKNNLQGSIAIGNISMRVPLNTLRVANEKSLNNIKPSIADPIIQVEQVERSKIEYDCRGMRLEEFEALIQVITSDLLMEKIPFVTIIHGHGTGVLKNWLRKHIRNHPDLMVVPSDSGNDGETQIQLV